MATNHSVIVSVCLVLSMQAKAQSLADAEVRLPYGELQTLIALPDKNKPEPRKPELLSVRLRITLENDHPVLDATFRALAFSEAQARLALIAGELSIIRQSPEDALILSDSGALCLSTQSAGVQSVQLRLLPLKSRNTYTFSVPACPSVIIEPGEWPDKRAVRLVSGNIDEVLTAAQSRPIPGDGSQITLSILDAKETIDALLPPKPSQWTWQNLAVVMPGDDGLIYQILSRANADDGSGLDASFPIPPDAQNFSVSGKDLSAFQVMRSEARQPALKLTWSTRGILDREVIISYRMPHRPLDRSWKLHAPGDETTRTRFMIASSPVHAYEAEGLGPRCLAKGLHPVLAKALNGLGYHSIDAKHSAEISVEPVPIIATDEGVVKLAEWAVSIEPDGAMLATGDLLIEHDAPLDFLLNTPNEMKLLSCELNGAVAAVVDLGQGKIKISIPQQNRGASKLNCKFTKTTNALDPVEGVIRLALPQTPFFIHELHWQIMLPSGLEAETNGNLVRVPSVSGRINHLSLRKNLCRDERPEIQVFYQRADLKQP